MIKKPARILLFALFLILALVVVACAAPPTSVPPTRAPVSTNPPAPTSAPVATNPPATSAPATKASAATAVPTAATTAAQVKRGGTLTIAYQGAIKTLVSAVDPGKTGIAILNNTVENLLGYDEAYATLISGVAKGLPETSADFKTFTFKLREGIKFQNGKELTSEDVKYTFQRLLDPAYGSTYGTLYRTYIDTVETPDKYTVVFKMKIPWATFPAYAGGNHARIETKETAESPDYGKTLFNGTGPFMIKQWVQGDRVVLVRNPNYWNAGPNNMPYLDQVIVRTIPDTSAMLAAFEAGEIDVIVEPDFKDLKRYASDPKYKVIAVPGTDSTQFIFNTARPPFNDKRLRQAISKGIDRKEIVDTLFYGYADPAGDFFSNIAWAHDPTIKAPYDPETAKSLLKEAGYGPSNPFKFTLLPRTESIYVDQAVLIQKQLQKIGVEVTVKPVEYTTLSGMTLGPATGWTGDAALSRYSAIRPATYEYTYDLFGAAGAANRGYINKPGGYQNPVFEQKLLEAMTYSDFDPVQQKKAFPLYQELSKMWLDEAPGLVLNFWQNPDISRSYVQGWQPAVGDLISLKQVWLNK